ncbi:hypothetical protein, partial [uncultured Duncaniella sp.]|uniref:hypothetical protein n=1 Tax=uncultured Duncaniella sp. TaxID=2768039 RepID=UPI00272C72E7
ILSRLNNYFDLRKISASKNNSENKSSVGSVSGLAKAEQPQILPNHCIYKSQINRVIYNSGKRFSKNLAA